MGATAGCLALAKVRQKTFSSDIGDVDIEAFCGSEDAMSIRRVVCVDNLQVTGRAFDMITHQCPWLVEVDLSGSGCKGARGECGKE